MISSHRLISAALVLLFVAFAAPVSAERLPLPEVRIGAEAPPLKVMKWVKGKPVEELREGEVYVVEFWATWCGPCIAAMPHITEIAKKLEGKVTVMGISIAERPAERTDEAILALVEPFVEKQGDKMGYCVGVDSAEDVMRESWFRAAGRTGIPSTFIVGKDRKIAWVGHPMQMDKVLDQVIDGTWDMKAAAEKQAKDWEHQQDLKEVLDPVTAALRERDYKAVVDAANKAIEKMPETEGQLRPIKFDALLRSDEAAAGEFMKELAKKGIFEKTPSDAYNFWMAMNRQASQMKNPDWETLAGILEKAVQANEKQYTMTVALADVFAKMSKFDKAAETQKKAIDAAAAAVENGSRVPPSWVEAQKKKLTEYETKRDGVTAEATDKTPDT
jgi:thiol-disulfide isomerase/thioredoxin